MGRGRPFSSPIRHNIVEILNVLNKAYGYQLHKIYVEIFGKCTREVIYYHLRTGAKLKEFELTEIKQERGDYSWGKTVEKLYYTLGPKAQAKGDEQVKKWFENKKIKF